MADSSPGTLVSVLSADGYFLSIGAVLNEQLAELGVTRPQRLIELIQAEDQAAVQAAWDKVIGGATHAQVVARLPGGHWFQLQLGHDATAQHIQLCTVNVNQHVKNEQSCALYQKAFDTLPMMIAISDDRGCFQLVNQGYCTHYGYSRSDMIGQPFTMIIQPAERGRWMQWHQNILAGTIEPGREAPVTYRDGSTGFVAVTADRLQLADGSRYRMTTISDVTERRRMAQREQLLSAQLTTIARQAEMISRLLLPILPVWPGVLCVPLLSEAGEALGTSLKEELLAAVVRSRARLILLDLTGMVRVEKNTATQLISVTTAVRLLGAQALLTGVSPEVARALVTSGADLTALRSYATLHEGLRACMTEHGDRQK